MLTSTVKYLGDLRTECTHAKSNTTIVTDAPVDNNGKGSAFSPTDLVATAYASCMLTIMGIYCNEHQVTFKYAEAKVTKIMASDPRRIGAIEIEIDLRGNDWDDKTAQKVINAGKACPVARTLENNVTVTYNFIL